MICKGLMLASGLALASTGAFAQVPYGAPRSDAPAYVGDGRSVFIPNAQNNGDPSAPAAGGGYETRESPTYGGTQLPGHE